MTLLSTPKMSVASEKSIADLSNDVLTFILSYLPTLDIVISTLTLSRQFHTCSLLRLRSFDICVLQDESIPIRNESTRWSSKTMLWRCILRHYPRDNQSCSMHTLQIQMHHLIMFLSGAPLPTVRNLDIIKTVAKVGSRDQLLLSQLPFSLKYDEDIFERLRKIFPNLTAMDVPHMYEQQGLIDVWKQWPQIQSLRMGMLAMKDELSTEYSQRDSVRRRRGAFGANQDQAWLAGWIEQLREERQRLFLFEPNKVGFRFEHLTSLHINSHEKHYALLSDNDLPQFLYVVERCPALEEIVFFRNQSPILHMLQSHLNEDESEIRESRAYRQHVNYWNELARHSKLRSITILDDFIDWDIHFFIRHLRTLETFKVLGQFAPLAIHVGGHEAMAANTDELLELLQNNPNLKCLKIKDRYVSNEFYNAVIAQDLPLDSLHLRVREDEEMQEAGGIPQPLMRAAGLTAPPSTNSRLIVPQQVQRFAIWDTNAHNLSHLTPLPALRKLIICCSDTRYMPHFSTFFPNLEELTVFCRDKRIFIESSTIKMLNIKSQSKHGCNTKDVTVDAPALEDLQIAQELLKELTHLNVISNQSKPLRLHNAVNLKSLYYSSPNQTVLVLIAKDLEQMHLCTPKLSLLMATAHNFSFVSDGIMENLDRCLVIQSVITPTTLQLFHQRTNSLKSLLFFNCTFELSHAPQEEEIQNYEEQCHIPSVDRLVMNQLRPADIDLADFVSVVPNCKQFSIHCTSGDDLSTLKNMHLAANTWKHLTHLQLDNIVVNKDVEMFLPYCEELTHFTYESQVQELSPLTIPRLDKLWMLRVSNSLVQFEHEHPHLFHLEISPLYSRSPAIEQLDSSDVFETPRMTPARGAGNDLLAKRFAIRDATAREEMCLHIASVFEYCPNLSEFFARSLFTEDALFTITESCLLTCRRIRSMMFDWVRPNVGDENSLQIGDTLKTQDKLQEFIIEMRPENSPLCFVFV